MTKAKPEAVPTLPRTKAGRIEWLKVPGFMPWARATAPNLTNLEWLAAIRDRYGVEITRAMGEAMRRSYGLAQNRATRQRAYAAREKTAEPKAPVDPVEKMEVEQLRQDVARLSKGRTFFEVVGERVIRAVKTLPPPPPPTVVYLPKLQPPATEEAILLISDVQAGLRVDAEEMGGLGGFNIEILLQEIKTLQDTTIDILTRLHPNVRRLHLFFLGDLIDNETIYPGQLRQLEHRYGAIEQTLLCYQAFGAMQVTLAGVFESVSCRGVIGNHGRMGRKGEHGPMSNFDHMLYRMWEAQFADHKRIHWRVAKSWWDVADVMGWRFLLVHGDNAGHGFAGIPFYAFIRHKTKYREMLRRLRNEYGDFDYMVAGHVSELSFFRDIFINGSFPGGTEWSIKDLQANDVPGQWLLTVHPKNGVVVHRPIHLQPLRPEPAALRA